MDWYYSKNDKQHGPVSEEDLKSKLSSGEVTEQDLAWCEGMGDWKPVGTLQQFKPAGSAAPPAPVPQGAPSPMGAPGAPRQAMAPVAPTSGLAITSLICGIIGICGFFACFIPCIVGLGGIICGHMAMGEIKKSQDRIQGKGLAIAGMIMGYISVVVLVFGFLFFVLMGVAAERGSDYDSYDDVMSDPPFSDSSGPAAPEGF